MAQKTLFEMTFAELSEELEAANVADQMAEYQDGLGAWRAAKDSAQAWLSAVRVEIDARLARLAAGGGVALAAGGGVAVEEQGHGG